MNRGDPLANWEARWPPPSLPAATIDVWRVPLTAPPAQLAQARTLLTPNERARADRFIFDKHRSRFALGRAAVRQILAAYQQVPPEALQLEYEALGKPRLAGQLPGTGLCFNFSNSHELGLLAVTRDVEVGADLEFHRTLMDMLGLAQRFFCPEELAKLQSLQATAQVEAFFRLWTRKEAFLKAVGKGLTFPLNEVEVSCLVEEPPAIRRIAGKPAGDWRLTHLDPATGYVAAIACQRHGDTLRAFSLS